MPTPGDLKSGDSLFCTTPPPPHKCQQPHYLPRPCPQIHQASMVQDIMWSLTKYMLSKFAFMLKWVFSLNFSSAGNWRFMAGKPQDTFLGGGGMVEWGTWLGPCCKILELSSLKCHSLYFKQIGHCFLRQQFKMFDSNNFTQSSMRSFQNVWPIKRKVVFSFIYLWESDLIKTHLRIF